MGTIQADACILEVILRNLNTADCGMWTCGYVHNFLSNHTISFRTGDAMYDPF